MAGPVSTDSVILATGGYDHTIKFWAASTGAATRTLQHSDSPVNSLAIAGDGSMIAAGGYQRIRMFDLTSNNLNPIVNYEGISKNIMTVGFQVFLGSHKSISTGGLTGGWTVDVHRRRGLFSEDLGPEDEESLLSEGLPSQQSSQLCQPPSQPAG